MRRAASTSALGSRRARSARPSFLPHLVRVRVGVRVGVGVGVR